MATKKFEIIEISIFQHDSIEPLGSKRKFWFENDTDSLKKLFKIGRANTGEDWVEVVVAELCTLLNIPHAKYQFAKWNNDEGTITENFVPKGGRLVHGNEVLATISNGEYPENSFYKVREYKLKLIIALMKHPSFKLPIDYVNTQLTTVFDVFMSYVMLDCLISNPDRHHENWGFIVYDNEIYLSPTYDHASGLGCRETEKNKKKRLASKDKGFQVASFVKKAKTPFYHKHEKLTTLKAFEMCAVSDEKIAIYWLEQLECLNFNAVQNIFSKIPNHLISDISIEFALKILEENKKRLLNMKNILTNV
ncbi:hypothetical protein [Candidatus Parabeggiatoa sp. HSG14]|uniref:hypothetical protein n=1 Tax=Candidatus Parabeggiatoa sp. HSG14 TaxID=3055593 RepID=UPI0025A7C036|nr:hypothetical protein [Thiotrichales bacterium HSG14]